MRGIPEGEEETRDIQSWSGILEVGTYSGKCIKSWEGCYYIMLESCLISDFESNLLLHSEYTLARRLGDGGHLWPRTGPPPPVATYRPLCLFISHSCPAAFQGMRDLRLHGLGYLFLSQH